MNKIETGTKVGPEVEGNIITSTSGPKKRNWFITINNYSEQEINVLNTIDVKYIIWQKEEGEKCHTPHIHACMIFKSSVVWPKRHFPRADIEIVKNLNACIKYCSKLETRVEGPFERGERPKGRGTRTDLDNIAHKVLHGTSLNDIAKDNPAMYVRYHRGLQALQQTTIEHRSNKIAPCVIWLWGKAGVGKTRIPTTIFPGNKHYIKDGSKWWSNYNNEKCVIIDDFDGKWPYRDFLRLLDRNKYTCEIKGGNVIFNSPFIFISCEHSPSYYWTDNELAQVTRRLHTIMELKSFDDYEKNLYYFETLCNEYERRMNIIINDIDNR